MGTGSGFDKGRGARKAGKQAAFGTIALGVGASAVAYLATPEGLTAIAAILPGGLVSALVIPAVHAGLSFASDWFKHRRPRQQGGVMGDSF